MFDILAMALEVLVGIGVDRCRLNFVPQDEAKSLALVVGKSIVLGASPAICTTLFESRDWLAVLPV